jgi:hypothetical protein
MSPLKDSALENISNYVIYKIKKYMRVMEYQEIKCNDHFNVHMINEIAINEIIDLQN